MTHANYLTVLLKLRFPTIKFVYTSHNFNLGSKFRELFTLATKKLRNADILFSKKMFRKIYRKDAVIIPNGISTVDYNLETQKFKQFTFICIGRLAAAKNQIALIEPVKKLKKQGFDFQLLLVGEGDNRPIIEKAIYENQLEDSIKLLGLRRDIPLLCNQAHCLLLPSLWEGLPIALLEAGSSSLPVITTNVGSIPTLIDDDCGYLLTNLDQMTAQMTAVLTDYASAKGKGALLKEKVKTYFDIGKIVQQHEQLYSRLVA